MPAWLPAGQRVQNALRELGETRGLGSAALDAIFGEVGCWLGAQHWGGVAALGRTFQEGRCRFAVGTSGDSIQKQRGSAHCMPFEEPAHGPGHPIFLLYPAKTKRFHSPSPLVAMIRVVHVSDPEAVEELEEPEEQAEAQEGQAREEGPSTEGLFRGGGRGGSDESETSALGL